MKSPARVGSMASLTNGEQGFAAEELELAKQKRLGYSAIHLVFGSCWEDRVCRSGNQLQGCDR